MEDWDLNNCRISVERYKMKAMVDIELKRYKEAISLLSDFTKKKEYIVLKKVLLRAYVRSAEYAAEDNLLSDIALTSDRNEWLEVYLLAVKELIWMDKKNIANIYLDSIINTIRDLEGKIDEGLQKVMAESLYFREKYQQADKVLEKLFLANPELIFHNSLLAIVYQKSGKTSLANSRIKAPEDLREDHQYGNVDYALAQYYANVSDEENTIKFMMKSIADGHWYETGSFQNDPIFKAYFETEAFDRILKFWH